MSAAAWVLPLPGGVDVAVGQGELRHLLDQEPELFPIPVARGPCSTLLLWEDEPTPLAELAPAGSGPAAGLVAIVAFDLEGTGRATHGAIRIAAPARRAVVADDAASPASEVPAHLLPFSRAAFRDGAGVVPVLDLHAVFGRPGR